MLLRLIQVLVHHGFVRRTAHGEYAVSLKLWRIGCNAVDSEAVRDEVIPLLRNLVESTGETAHYAVYEDGHSMYVEKVDGLHPIRAYTKVGGRSPAYATATGKALLAWRDADEIVEIGRTAKRWTGTTHVGAAGVARDVGGDAARRLRDKPRGMARIGLGYRRAGVRSLRQGGRRRRDFRSTRTRRGERRQFVWALKSVAAELSSHLGATARATGDCLVIEFDDDR